jgi:ubiquinone/menaquinone biosynthesis C-methylase UbiE
MGRSPDPDNVKDAVRDNLSKFSRRAFNLLPRTKFRRILDIGCGSGVPTIELAKLSQAKIIAVDIDRSRLELLEKKLKEHRLEDRIETVHRSMDKMNFDCESFDLIWSEGSIYVPGFARGLREWRRYLMPSGFMVIHDERGDVEKKLKLIAGIGYELLDHFILDRDIWWNEYYSPLEKEIRMMEKRYSAEPGISVKFEEEMREIERFKKNPGNFESVFFVLRKIRL